MSLDLAENALDPGHEEPWHEAVRAFLSREWPITAAHELMDGAEADWSALGAAEQRVGLTGLLVPEDRGGAGASIRDLGIAFQEIGRALYPGPCLASSLATAMVAQFAGETADLVLAELLTGMVPGVSSCLGTAPDQSLHARYQKGAWHVTGTLLNGLGKRPEVVLLTAVSEKGRGLFAVYPGSPGCTLQGKQNIDPTRPLFDLSMDEAEARLVGYCSDESDPDGVLGAIGSYCIASDSLGVCARSVDSAAKYASERIQFGRPIGQYQAVKHTCADMLVHYAGSEATLVEVGHRVGSYPRAAILPDRAAELSVAKVYSCRAAYQSSLDNLQLHGGAGFLWENDEHLYVRRSSLSLSLYGDERFHLSRLALWLAEGPGPEEAQ